MQCYDPTVRLRHSLAHGHKGRSGSDRPVVCVMICVPAVTSVCFKKGRRQGAQLRRRRRGDGVDKKKSRETHSGGILDVVSKEMLKKCSVERSEGIEACQTYQRWQKVHTVRLSESAVHCLTLSNTML